MVVAKWLQIRVGDKVMVWQFYNNVEETEHFGSRGITLTDEELKQLDELPFRELRIAKLNGIEIKDEPETLLEKLAKRAYDEYLQAKAEEEKRKMEVIE